MSNHYSLNILAADDSGLTRIVRKSPLSSAAIMKALTSILFSLCIIPTNAQQRTYSINQLKKHTWTETLTSFEEKSVETLRFTDKEMITSRTRTWLKTNESYTYTFKNPYYLANGKARRFNYSLPGDVTQRRIGAKCGSPDRLSEKKLFRSILNDQTNERICNHSSRW